MSNNTNIALNRETAIDESNTLLAKPGDWIAWGPTAENARWGRLVDRSERFAIVYIPGERECESALVSDIVDHAGRRWGWDSEENQPNHEYVLEHQ